jgi:hypothetical protein
MILGILIAWITVFSLAITVISAFAYRKTGSRKVLLVTIAFAMFFIKGVFYSIALMQANVDWDLVIISSLVLDFMILILLFIAIVVRKK